MHTNMPLQRQHVQNLIESSRRGGMAIVLATAGFLLGVEVAPAGALLRLSTRLVGVAMEMVVRETKSFSRRNVYLRALQMDRVSGLQKGVCYLHYISHAPLTLGFSTDSPIQQSQQVCWCCEFGALY